MTVPILIIAGPTATGKTGLALEIASRHPSDILSADSRQVYISADIVTGKDIPDDFRKRTSDLLWHNRRLSYYTDGRTRIWLTDLVRPDEPFNISFWKESFDLAIRESVSSHKLPIVVGGTGLYLRSVMEKLDNISVPLNPGLRKQLSAYNVFQLFDYLKNIDSSFAESMNHSDRHNPRRLFRAIEISTYFSLHPNTTPPRQNSYVYKFIGLTAPRQFLVDRIVARVDSRLQAGAASEAGDLLSRYSPDLPALTACGYRAFLQPDPRQAWVLAETQYLKRQLTWFSKTRNLDWFDISLTGWQNKVLQNINSWYN